MYTGVRAMPTPVSSSPNPLRVLACPVCGLTADALRDTGRMGCATCYDTFAVMVEQAARELHNIAPVPPPAPAPALPPDRLASPWPTRRAEVRPITNKKPK